LFFELCETKFPDANKKLYLGIVFYWHQEI